MTSKQLRALNRVQLLEIMHHQELEIERLESENDVFSTQLSAEKELSQRLVVEKEALFKRMSVERDSDKQQMFDIINRQESELERLNSAKDELYKRLAAEKDELFQRLTAEKAELTHRITSEKEESIQRVITEKEEMFKRLTAENEALSLRFHTENEELAKRLTAEKEAVSQYLEDNWSMLGNTGSIDDATEVLNGAFHAAQNMLKNMKLLDIQRQSLLEKAEDEANQVKDNILSGSSHLVAEVKSLLDNHLKQLADISSDFQHMAAEAGIAEPAKINNIDSLGESGYESA